MVPVRKHLFGRIRPRRTTITLKMLPEAAEHSSAHSTCLMRRVSTIMSTMEARGKQCGVALQPFRLKNHPCRNYMSPRGIARQRAPKIVAVVPNELYAKV